MLRNLKTFGLATWLLSSTITLAANRSDPEVVKDVDLTRYVGLWHEAAHSKNFFQRNCLRSTAEYALLSESSISVKNTCYKKKGKISDIEGIATITDPDVPAKLRVRFNFFARGDYWITHLDPDYQWAVVSGPRKRSIFILSRRFPMEESLLKEIVQKLKDEGYATETLVYDVSESEH